MLWKPRQGRLRHVETQNSLNSRVKNTLGIRGRATTPIPRFADNLRTRSSSRLSRFICKFAMPMSRGARGVEIEELHVHVGLIGQICRRGMLVKGAIICQPDSIAEFLICTKNQQLILTYISPPMRKVGSQHEGLNRESLHPSRDVLNTSFGFLEGGCQH